MKKSKLYIVLLVVSLAGVFTACDDFLDREPLSSASPEIYFTDASQLESYANQMYADILPSHGNWSYGTFGYDNNTDNQAGSVASTRFADGLWKVPNSEGDNWKFTQIYRCNYFLSNVLLKYGDDVEGTQNTISGNLASIKHYIGEVYFLRACEYFKRYQMFGDFPIITQPLNDDLEELRESNKRMPRTEVARFILSDLDNACKYMEARICPPLVSTGMLHFYSNHGWLCLKVLGSNISRARHLFPTVKDGRVHLKNIMLITTFRAEI